MGSLVLGAFVLAIVVYAVMRGIWPGGDVWRSRLVAARIVIVSSVHRVASEPPASLTSRVHAVLLVLTIGLVVMLLRGRPRPL
jgi:hypothetical protein